MEENVIIGGGPAGLTAAYELSKHGRGSLVLEQDELVGGISRTVEHNGYRFDIGGHRFFTKVPYVQELWEELLGEEFLIRPRLSRIYYDGKFFDYPLRPFAALKSLGPLEAMRIGASYVRSNVFPERPERNFEQWVSNRFGKRLFQIFFKTYTEKVWGMPCSEISADWAAQRIKNLDLVALVKSALTPSGGKQQITTLIEEFQYPRFGPGQMWETCVERLAERGVSTRLRTRVESLEHADGRVRAVHVRGPNGSERIEGESFVSTMPVRALLNALQPAPPAAILEAANRLRYRDFLTVGLMVRGRDLFPDNWIYIHSPDVKLGRIQNFKNWSPAMVPDPSMSSLGLEYFVQEGDELWEAPDDELLALGERECVQLGLIPANSVEDGVVIRMPKAYPVYDDVYQQALQEIRTWLAGLPNLHLVGRNGQHRYNNQDHSMLTAVYAARNIVAGREVHDVWDVNVEEEYHEEVQEERTSSGASGERLVPGAAPEPALEARLREAFSRYDPQALGVALSVAGALWLVLLTARELLAHEPELRAKLALLANYLPGFRVSWTGALVGALECAAAGFLFGWVLAKLINGLIRIEERKILGHLEAQAANLLDHDR